MATAPLPLLAPASRCVQPPHKLRAAFHCCHHCTLHPNCLQPFKGLSATILRESLYATGYLAIAPILREALSKQPAVQVRWRGARAKLPDGSTGPAGSDAVQAWDPCLCAQATGRPSSLLFIDDPCPAAQDIPGGPYVLSGIIAGLIATVSSQPADTIKTRMQVGSREPSLCRSRQCAGAIGVPPRL